MKQEAPEVEIKDEAFFIEGKRCTATRNYVLYKNQDKPHTTQAISYLSTVQDNQIRKLFEITCNHTTITLEDCITVHQPMQKESPKVVASEDKNQIKNSSTGQQNSRSKKLVLLKQSMFGNCEQGSKNDKKNIVKNVINAYLKYLKTVQEENKQVDPQVELLKEMINSKKYNNQLIASIVEEDSLRCYFKHFLATEAADWLERSKIKNKNSYEQALRVYEKLCDREHHQGQPAHANQPSSGQDKSNNSLECFRELENHELQEEIQKFQ